MFAVKVRSRLTIGFEMMYHLPHHLPLCLLLALAPIMDKDLKMKKLMGLSISQMFPLAIQKRMLFKFTTTTTTTTTSKKRC